jgi:hypothetical protein
MTKEEYFYEIINRIENIVKNTNKDDVSEVFKKIKKLITKENSTTLLIDTEESKKLSYDKSNLLSWQLDYDLFEFRKGNLPYCDIILYEFHSVYRGGDGTFENIPIFNHNINIKSLRRESTLDHILGKS